MRSLCTSRLLAVCFLSFAAIASAQQTQSTAVVTAVPRLVRFAGTFHPPANQPAGPVGATFAIYGEQEGGTPLWSEDRNVELDANGNYTALLGSSHNEGVPVELFTAGESRWLQVKFYLPAEVDLPRVLLVSVPYALKAGDADTLGGKPASAYALAGSAIMPPAASSGSVAAASPAAGLSVRTAAYAMPAATSGSAGYIAQFTDATDLGDSVMFQNGSSIGINTTTTLDILDVVGSITAEVDGGPTSGPALDLRNTPPTGLGIGSINFFTYPNQTVPSAQWQAKDIGGFTASQTLSTAGNLNKPNQALVPRLTVMGGTGNVGIGTIAPVALLEVNGNTQVDGNLTLSGSILSGGVPIIQAPTGASGNFGAGLASLPPATTGTGDTAVGDSALHANTTGSQNTASGFDALYSNTSGVGNTALGWNALKDNISGNFNTATGNAALELNTSGADNTAVGDTALFSNSTGDNNTAVGNGSLYSNATGGFNTSTGSGALFHNTGGSNNTATGFNALTNNITGNNNTAIGNYALEENTGSGNIAIGYDAGVNVATTSNNIHIGNLGSAGDSGAIRIGTAGTQTTAFIAGILGVTTGNNDAVPVVIDSNGQLGTISSSRRYKEDIRDMGDSSSGLLRLRPVTFRYKKPFADGSQPVQYGLIAEEVAEVYPDLVARSADGRIETVKYQVLDTMLLNEVRKQNATITAQKDQIRSLEERLAKVEAALGQSPLSASTR
jgi:hypothetical protein